MRHVLYLDCPLLEISQSPLIGIEIVGAIAEIVGKPQGESAIGEEYISARCFGWEGDGFAMQISECRVARYLHTWKGGRLGSNGHGECVLRDEFFTLFCSNLDASQE